MRERSPETVPLIWHPYQSGARLSFKVREVSAQQFGPDTQHELVVDERDIVLEKTGQQTVEIVGGVEHKAGPDFQETPLAEAHPKAVNKLLARLHLRSRNKVDVKCIAALAEIGFIAIGTVVI